MCAVKIKELLVLAFDKKKSNNKELLELGLDFDSLLKRARSTLKERK